MSRQFWIVLPCAVAATLLLFAAWYPYTSGGRQRYNMQRAEERLPAVRAMLEADPRFREVTAGVYTGQDGAIGLFGRVETADDLFRLMRAVAAEQLPVAVHWQVKVLAAELDVIPPMGSTVKPPEWYELCRTLTRKCRPSQSHVQRLFACNRDDDRLFRG